MTPESHLHPAAIAAWIFAITTRLLARSLNMPEPLVVSTGAYVYAQVAAAETRSLGYGGISRVSRASGISHTAIRRALEQLDTPPPPAGRVRRPGGCCGGSG